MELAFWLKCRLIGLGFGADRNVKWGFMGRGERTTREWYRIFQGFSLDDCLE